MDTAEVVLRSNGDTAEGRQREVNVLHLVKDRITQIADLLEAVDNSTLVSGEVTKGPRTVLQRLPRHMRRRAMSYNVKRLPRSQRLFAAAATKMSRHRKKPLSRFWRRRPHRLLKEYSRRQRKHAWLETHIWHAKRFYMLEKYGYKLASRSFQRAFRPSYRDSMHHCIIHDVSFLHCLQIITEDKTRVIKLLRPLFAPSTSATIACKMALEGSYEVPVLLYKNGRYPYGFIGPARFMWCRQNESQWSLLLWSHPATSAAIIDCLSYLLGLRKGLGKYGKVEEAERSDERRGLKSASQWYRWNPLSKGDFYISRCGKCALFDLRGQLIRFRLYGPKSIAVLDTVLHAVEKSDLQTDWMRDFKAGNEYWKNIVRGRTSGEFPDGTVLTVLVSDPRLSRPVHKTKPVEDNKHCPFPVDILDVPLPRPALWDTDIREKVLEKKISEEQLQKRRKDNLAFTVSNDAQVPVVLVVRNIGSGTTSRFTGIDLIAPAGFGMDFWLALQRGTARAVALRDQKSICFESDRLYFPSDVPDCDAGLNVLKTETQTMKKKYFAKPYNRRINYWPTLSIKHPFKFEWNELVSDWLSGGKAQESTHVTKAYVLRDRRCLTAIDYWIRGKTPEPTEMVILHSMALVPVRLDAQTTGRPLRFAVLCIPEENELILARTPEGFVKGVEEPKRNVANEKGKDPDTQKDTKDMTDIQGYLKLSGTRKETVVSLHDLFPDREMLRKRKKTNLKKQKRQKVKAAKRRRTAASDSADDAEGLRRKSSLALQNEKPAAEVSYLDSCSRRIIGRVVRGDYSFCSAKGRAIGYCSLTGLKMIRNGRVLFRNTTSKCYHLATISVLKTPLDM